MYRGFQRKIITVGGRLSPWIDEDQLNKQRLEKQMEKTAEIAEPEPINNLETFWQKRRKSIQYEEGKIQIISGIKKGQVFPRKGKSEFLILY